MRILQETIQIIRNSPKYERIIQNTQNHKKPFNLNTFPETINPTKCQQLNDDERLLLGILMYGLDYSHTADKHCPFFWSVFEGMDNEPAFKLLSQDFTYRGILNFVETPENNLQRLEKFQMDLPKNERYWRLYERVTQGVKSPGEFENKVKLLSQTEPILVSIFLYYRGFGQVADLFCPFRYKNFRVMHYEEVFFLLSSPQHKLIPDTSPTVIPVSSLPSPKDLERKQKVFAAAKALSEQGEKVTIRSLNSVIKSNHEKGLSNTHLTRFFKEYEEEQQRLKQDRETMLQKQLDEALEKISELEATIENLRKRPRC